MDEEADGGTGGVFIGFWRRRSDLLTTVMLTTATVLTAWAAFQAAKWSGVQAIAFADAGKNRTESTRASTAAGQLATIDVNLWLAWLDAAQAVSDEPRFQGDDPATERALGEAITTGNTLAGFLFQRFRDEFKPAVNAWLATQPFDDADAPPTPFGLPEYQLETEEQADQLATAADLKGQEARENNQQSDNYVLLTVFFATVLFFAGLSLKMKTEGTQIAVFLIGLLILVGAVAALLIQPIEFSPALF